MRALKWLLCDNCIELIAQQSKQCEDIFPSLLQLGDSSYQTRRRFILFPDLVGAHCKVPIGNDMIDLLLLSLGRYEILGNVHVRLYGLMSRD